MGYNPLHPQAFQERTPQNRTVASEWQRSGNGRSGLMAEARNVGLMVGARRSGLMAEAESNRDETLAPGTSPFSCARYGGRPPSSSLPPTMSQDWCWKPSLTTLEFLPPSLFIHSVDIDHTLRVRRWPRPWGLRGKPQALILLRLSTQEGPGIIQVPPLPPVCHCLTSAPPPGPG